jgi:hypothetical protein
MLKQMADSLNLSVPEFEKMMREEHGLVPPDDEKENGDYDPPKRKMSINTMTPEVARLEADILRKSLLDPVLSKREADEAADHIAQCVSAYGEVDQRMEELTTPRGFDSEAHSNAERLEHNALIQVQQDKSMTTHQVDSLNSTATVLSLMQQGKIAGQPIDLFAFKEGMQKQMDDLVASGTERETRIAQLAITAQKAAESILLESMIAPTSEAKAVMIKHGVASLEAAGRLVEKLHLMDKPIGGRVVDHVSDKQIKHSHKKLEKESG